MEFSQVTQLVWSSVVLNSCLSDSQGNNHRLCAWPPRISSLTSNLISRPHYYLDIPLAPMRRNVKNQTIKAPKPSWLDDLSLATSFFSESWILFSSLLFLISLFRYTDVAKQSGLIDSVSEMFSDMSRLSFLTSPASFRLLWPHSFLNGPSTHAELLPRIGAWMSTALLKTLQSPWPEE